MSFAQAFTLANCFMIIFALLGITFERPRPPAPILIAGWVATIVAVYLIANHGAMQ